MSPILLAVLLGLSTLLNVLLVLVTAARLPRFVPARPALDALALAVATSTSDDPTTPKDR
nr:hypothetical protein [Micromonospora sp. DSM 115978]